MTNGCIMQPFIVCGFSCMAVAVYGIISLYVKKSIWGEIIVLLLKIVFAILLCLPMAYIAIYLFSRLMDVILKKR